MASSLPLYGCRSAIAARIVLRGASCGLFASRSSRWMMSATLVLEAITVLLAIPVAANTGGGVGPLGLIIICALAVLLVAACGIVSRPYALQVILGLQVVMIGCWLITPPLGIMGIVFGVVWAIILWFRSEFRRRLAAGTLPGPPQPSGQ